MSDNLDSQEDRLKRRLEQRSRSKKKDQSETDKQ
jgi:hypothetical protein